MEADSTVGIRRDPDPQAISGSDRGRSKTNQRFVIPCGVERWLCNRGSGDHTGLTIRSVSTITKNRPENGVGSRTFDNTQKFLPSAIASS
jgi:hypothetical protein